MHVSYICFVAFYVLSFINGRSTKDTWLTYPSTITHGCTRSKGLANNLFICSNTINENGHDIIISVIVLLSCVLLFQLPKQSVEKKRKFSTQESLTPTDLDELKARARVSE